MLLKYCFSTVWKERCGLVGMVLVFCIALQLTPGCASTPGKERELVALSSPALSPDGRLVAVEALIPGHLRWKLALFDVETGSLRIFDSPPDQSWRDPSFSPSGDRLVFLRICRFECASGPKGVHIGILDLETGRDTTVTAAPDLIRLNPIFAPGGRFVFYGTLRVGNVDRRSYPKSVYNRAYGFYTRTLHILNLDTGTESEVIPGNNGKLHFLRTLPVGFLDEKTLVIRGMSLFGGDLQEVLEKRVQHVHGIIGHSPEDEDYLYKVSFDRSFIAAPKTPQARELELLETDWVRPVSHQVIEPGVMISFDTGRITFVDRSERNRARCLFGCSFEYDVFVGNNTTIRQVTSLHLNKISDATISKSGNRVAFLVANDRHYEELWMHDISSGRTWQTELGKQLVAISASGSR